MNTRNNHGYTLTEVLVASFLLAITISVASFLAVSFYKHYQEIILNVDTEEALLGATFGLQRNLSLAVDMAESAVSLNNTVQPAGAGKIIQFDGRSMGATPGQVETIAIFLRENGGHQTPPRSDYIQTGIFYARPTPTTSGVIFIDSAKAGNLSPKYSGLYFDKVVEFSVGNFETSLGSDPKLTSVEISITVRRFLSEKVGTWNFCPQIDISNGVAGCALTGKATFKDVNLKTRITFSNQIINNSDPRSVVGGTPYERIFGNLYLFPQR
ncbi:MAG TPA: prepilin-type N-terminal cleavage/methylation domain-containing protein [Bdellovibrio sp.]